MTKRQAPEPITHENAVGLEDLLKFNELRLARIKGNAVGDEEYRKFVKGRIATIKQQLNQCGMTAS